MARASFVIAALTTTIFGRAMSYSIPAPLSQRAPAHIGQRLADIRTPALIVKETVLAANLAKVHTILQGGPKVAIRPHGKAHKCVELARKQVCLSVTESLSRGTRRIAPSTR